MKWTIVIDKYNKNVYNYLYNNLNNQIINEKLSEKIELSNGDKINGEWVNYINRKIDIPPNFIKKIYKYLLLDYNKIEFNIINIDNNNLINIDELYPIKKNIKNINPYKIDDIFVFSDGSDNNNDKYSIIVTAFNSQNFIEDCLDSIENQSYFKDKDNFEVLLGIDGCEKTLEKVKSIYKKYRNLRVLMMDSNMGTYVTSNTLIDQTKYNNIIRFDSDDIMKQDMVYEINKYVNDYDIIRFSFINFKNNINNTYYNKDMFYPHGVVLYKKHIFDMCGGYLEWKCGADTELIERIKPYFKILKLEKELFYRRQHDNSLTKNKETGFDSDIRKEYSSLIGNHKYIWIDKKTNIFTEFMDNDIKIKDNNDKYNI